MNASRILDDDTAQILAGTIEYFISAFSINKRDSMEGDITMDPLEYDNEEGIKDEHLMPLNCRTTQAVLPFILRNQKHPLLVSLVY